jgi:site-specific DNA-methyltransferase (cytosine-N4-specific)
VEGHPARFPEKLPAFFIRFLTEPSDVVLDIFAGSNTTGAAAEAAGRRWLAFESRLATSLFRFAGERMTDAEAVHAFRQLIQPGQAPMRVRKIQGSLPLTSA